MLTTQEQIVEEIASLSDIELKAVVEYIQFLKHRPIAYQPDMTEEKIGALYAEFAEEDRAMGEEGMGDYLAGLRREEEDN